MNRNILKQTLLYSRNKHLYFALLNSRIFSDIKDDSVLWPIFEFKKYFEVIGEKLISANDLHGIKWKNKFTKFDNYIKIKCDKKFRYISINTTDELKRKYFYIDILINFNGKDDYDYDTSMCELEFSIYLNRNDIVKYLRYNSLTNNQDLYIYYSILYDNIDILQWLIENYEYKNVMNKSELIKKIRFAIKHSNKPKIREWFESLKI